MDSTSKLLIAAGATLALLVGVAVYATLTSVQSAGRATTTVVVAREAIPERTLFTGSNIDQLLTTRQVPSELVPPGAVPQPAQLIGKATTVALAPGEIVLDTPERLASSVGGAAGVRPSALIPRDKVALAIPASETLTVAGAVQPGDRVDVIATWNRANNEPVARTIFQDVPVFAVGPWQPEGRPRASNTPVATVTLLLDYQQAVVLEYLLETGGRIALALRRFDQGGTVPTEPVTIEELARAYLREPAGAGP
ncbi:MAG TPA: Flp pilus assembly protein CpaB [Chloroflexota bacterium]|jgi:pilus assembly protein CpaB|nr:Flp pilus assembly protein CpaB [Chloroflexota bacterium]